MLQIELNCCFRCFHCAVLSWPFLVWHGSRRISTSRGGTFSKSLVFQAISNVVVIGHDIFALLLCQFFNLGPHPAKLLFGFFSFFGPNKPTGRKCCSGIMSNFLNFLNLFWHYYLIGNIQDHFGAIQTPSRHP